MNIKRLIITAILAGISAVQPMHARDIASGEGMDPAIEAIHDDIRALKKGVEEEFNRIGASGGKGDVEPILDYVHDNIVLVAMNGDTVVGKQGIRDYFVKKMGGPDSTVASVHHTFNVAALTTLYGNDTGVAYGDSLGTYGLKDGTSFTADTYWTATMVREDGRWLLASFQFGPSIFDNPIVDKVIDMAYTIAVIVGIIGLIIGFILARFLARRKSGN